MDRTQFSVDGGGRLFTRASLEAYRVDLAAQLERAGKNALATRYREMSLDAFAANGGYVIVKK